jgi:hypothetical protein
MLDCPCCTSARGLLISGHLVALPTAQTSGYQKPEARSFTWKPKAFGRFKTGRNGICCTSNIQTLISGWCSPTVQHVSTKIARPATRNTAKNTDLPTQIRSFLRNGCKKHRRQPMISQNDRILDHLETVGSISFVEANDLYRVRSLPRRIADLRQRGHDIISEWKRDHQKYTRYSLATN